METAVSIVVPVYNVERCIEKCIKSVISQTSKRFELVLVDDGSKDRSIEIAENILKNTDLKYKLLKQKNQGASAARNNGIKHSEGKYIAFLDSDDYWEKDFIEEMLKRAEETNADIIFGGYREVDLNGNILKEPGTAYLYKITSGREAALQFLKGEFILTMNNAMFRREIIEEKNILFDTKRKYAEDMVFEIKNLLEVQKVVSVNKIIANYVIWDNSVSKKVSLSHLDCYYSFKDLQKYVEEKGGFPEIEKFITEYKIPYSIAHVFSVFSRDENFYDELFRFLNDKNVSEDLKKFKIQKFDKNNLRYLIQCRGMSRHPKKMMEIMNRLRK